MPNPANPQSLNRYSYALNNPVKYTDPTGHYTDKAIKTYLKDQYGDEWESYWKMWRENDAWMKLLSNAQGDDMLYKVSFDNSGNPFTEYFRFEGEGKDVLTGISKVAVGTNPEKTNLHDIYLNQGHGIGGVHFDDNGDLVNLGTVGGVHATTHKVSQAESTAVNVVIYSALFGLGTEGGALMWIAGVIGFAQIIEAPAINDLPGFKVGDNALLVCYNEPPWAYQETRYFRDGENIGHSMEIYHYYVGRTH